MIEEWMLFFLFLDIVHMKNRSMNQQENKNLKELLDEFLEVHYNDSFPQMVCEYIRATDMTKEEVDDLLGAMKEMVSL